MKDEVYLLDTSAIFTLLEDEEGAERVEELLRSENIILPFVVLIEVYYISLQRHSEEVADQRYCLLKRLPAKHLGEMDEPTLLGAATLKARFRLSLADAIIAAFAIRHKAILVHKDPEFEAISALVKLEPLP